jgi:GntR family transcriptional regulator
LYIFDQVKAHMQEFNPSRDRFTAAIPLYAQIAESLLDRIESGELVPGDRLPAERELSDMLSVNRMTVRRALNMLESQGLIIRRQGDGTYVARPKIERQASQLFPFTRGMERRGYKTGMKLITFEKKPAEASLANRLKIPVSTPVYRAFRLRLLNQDPVMLEEFTIPVHTFPDFDRFDLSSRSLYEIFTTEYGVTILQAHQSLEPVIATEYQAELLEIDTGSPLMLERRLAFDQQNRPVEYSKDLYRGDRFRFTTEIASLEL